MGLGVGWELPWSVKICPSGTCVDASDSYRMSSKQSLLRPNITKHYPKNLDTLTTYHTTPKIWTNPFDYLLMCLNCWLNGVRHYHIYPKYLDTLTPYYMIGNMRKEPLCDLWTMQALISQRICTGWSGPALSIYRINGYCSIYRWTENVQIRLHGCACLSGPSLFAYGIRAIFPSCTSYVLLLKFEKSIWLLVDISWNCLRSRFWVWILLEAEFSPCLYVFSLHTSFHDHPFIIQVWVNPSPAEPDIFAFENSVDPDQLASSEANWSGSALFVIKYC